MESGVSLMDCKFESKISLSAIFTGLLPMISAIISMYVHSSGSYLKTNYGFSIIIILVSIANLVASKMIKKFGEMFEVVQLGCFIGLATQLILNLYRETKYAFFIRLVTNIFESDVFLNFSPLLLSIIADFIICMFFDREDSVILKTVSCISLIFFTAIISQGTLLFYDWIPMLAFLIIPSFFLTLCLPSKKDKSKKSRKHKRIQAFIGCMVLSITVIVVMVYLCEIKMGNPVNYLNPQVLRNAFDIVQRNFMGSIVQPIKDFFLRGIRHIGDFISACKNTIRRNLTST